MKQLRYYGGWLEQMKMASTDPPEGSSGGGTPEFSEKPMAAVIADVASAGQDVLEEGTGFIHELYAVVPDGRGGLQVARGGVYSQYEFVSRRRWTDEEWRAALQRGQTPAAHPWLSGVVVR